MILLLGLLLTLFGGSVRLPEFRQKPAGETERVVVERNKFLNARDEFVAECDASLADLLAFLVCQCECKCSADNARHVFGAGTSFSFLAAAGQQRDKWSVSLGMVVCVGTATGCGLLNGAMIVALRVHPFIITLGTMAIYRGIAFVITTGQSVGGFPAAFSNLVKREAFGGLRLVPLAVMVLVTILGAVYLADLAAGRRIYAVGGNELASRYSGVRVERVKLSVYIISGLTAGIAALLALGYYGSASSGDGSGYELDVIASAVVGGASLSGGKGSALGALLGALIIKMIDNGIVILGIDQSYSRIIIGVVVILAVVLDQLKNWLEKRRLTKTV